MTAKPLVQLETEGKQSLGMPYAKETAVLFIYDWLCTK